MNVYRGRCSSNVKCVVNEVPGRVNLRHKKPSWVKAHLYNTMAEVQEKAEVVQIKELCCSHEMCRQLKNENTSCCILDSARKSKSDKKLEKSRCDHEKCRHPQDKNKEYCILYSARKLQKDKEPHSNSLSFTLIERHGIFFQSYQRWYFHNIVKPSNKFCHDGGCRYVVP